MWERSIVILIFCSVTLISCEPRRLISFLGYILPKALEHLVRYYNVNYTAISSVATELFDAVPVKLNDIHLLHYDINGTYTHINLKDTIDADTNQKMILIIHGYNCNATEEWIKNMAVTYQMKGFKNTFAVEWSSLSMKDILSASSSTKRVADNISSWLIENFLKKDLSAVKRVHLIGHSLGAHICGFIGGIIHKHYGRLIGRITGLDPAAPLFEYPVKLPPDQRLDSSDAMYVDGYHTCAGFAGFLSSVGHQDFYIDYGYPIQPGCSMGKLVDSISCSHERAHKIFIEAINSAKYRARQCSGAILDYFGRCNNNNIIIMGDLNNETDKIGNFYVTTDGFGNSI